MSTTATVNTSEEIRDILATAKTIAVVGCSDRPSRTSYTIYKYLKEHGYAVIPVNPNHSECDQDKAYPDLLSIPEDTRIDIVTIFRNPRFTADMVEVAVRRSSETGEKPVIWTQIGVSSPEADELAREAGLQYVKNRCIMVEHSRTLAK